MRRKVTWRLLCAVLYEAQLSVMTATSNLPPSERSALDVAPAAGGGWPRQACPNVRGVIRVFLDFLSLRFAS